MEISPEEAAQNSYQVFHFTLQALASQPEEHCEMMGDYNTAWELRDDALAGHYLIGSDLFTSEQESALLAFLAAVKPLPVNNMPSGSGRAVNLSAMQDPVWGPIRVLAQDLLATLEPVTQTNQAYFKNIASAP